MTTPLLVSLGSEKDYGSCGFSFDGVQMFHDGHYCRVSGCLFIGRALTDDMNEIVHCLAHETFHHIFVSWTEFDVFSLFQPAPKGFGTLVDYMFDRMFDPFGNFLLAFSVDDEYMLRYLTKSLNIPLIVMYGEER